MVTDNSPTDIAALRERFAHDWCICGHARSHHYIPGGSTVGCDRAGCTCRNYAWVDALKAARSLGPADGGAMTSD